MSTTRTPRSSSRRDPYDWGMQLKADDFSPATIKTKLAAVHAVANGARKAPWDLRPADVAGFFLARRSRPQTRIVYLNALSQYAKWARIPDPTTGIRRPPQPRGLPRPLGEKDLGRLLSAADTDVRLQILLAAFCGLRAHEVAKVHADDFTEQPDGSLTLRVLGKGSKWDVMTVPEIIAQEVRPRLIVLADYLFPGSRDGHMTPDAVSRRTKTLANRLGITMTFHQLRHRFGTQVHQAKGDLLLTQRAMRHANPQTTAGYAQVSDQARTDVLAALPVPAYTPERAAA